GWSRRLLALHAWRRKPESLDPRNRRPEDARSSSGRGRGVQVRGAQDGAALRRNSQTQQHQGQRDRCNHSAGHGNRAPGRETQEGKSGAARVGGGGIYLGSYAVAMGVLDANGDAASRVSAIYFVAIAPTNDSKILKPSVPPSSGSAARSGWGIMPRTLRPGLQIPAIFSSDPLGFASVVISPCALE